MATRKPEHDNEPSSVENNDNVPIRVIRKAIETNTTHNKVVTQLAIGFKKSKDEKISEISRKDCELIARIQEIDGNAFIESNQIKIEDPTEIPDGDTYKKLFNDGHQVYRGRLYIGCELHSSISVG